ncbi:hypothetical protein VYU27_010297, partial [Nannochloropsis oceanica]
MAHFFLRTGSAGRRAAFFAAAASGSAVLLGAGGMTFETLCKEEQQNKHKILIVGGGSGGLAAAAQLKIKGEKDIAVIEPSSVHYYQPLWTLVGGGIFPGTKSRRTEKEVMPKGVHWIQNKVTTFDPKNNTVTMADGKKVAYDYLIVAAGFQLNWDQIKGLPETIGKNGVVSVYDYEYAQD